jgi:outer membrane lipoprotein-sorting protein
MLVPRRDNATVGKLRLTVASDSGEIRGAEIFDPLGNVSRLQLNDIRRNQGLSDKDFVFEVPAGVDVISPPLGQ